MKKITALILSVVLVFSLAACSNTQQNDASDPVSSEAPSHAAESTPAEVTETEPPKAEDDTEPASSEPEEWLHSCNCARRSILVLTNSSLPFHIYLVD